MRSRSRDFDGGGRDDVIGAVECRLVASDAEEKGVE